MSTAMDTGDSSGEMSSASSVDFDDPMDWKVAAVHGVDSETKTSSLTYRPRRFIAKGNFGYITRILTSERETFALKQIDLRTRAAMQEINIMLLLKHPNLVRIKYYYKERFTKNHIRVFIIMEFLPRSLVEHIIRRHEKQLMLMHEEIASIMFQILRGLEHMHRRNIAHRDIKPHNVLIDVHQQIVKICDFGSAKNIKDPKSPNLTYVCSRWYRAPELLQQNAEYTTKVDIWSCGCVLGELVLLRPMFRGADTVDQWACIRDILGSPSAEEAKEIGMRPGVNDHQVQRKNLSDIFGDRAPQAVIDLFEKLLKYAHRSRPTAWSALAHPAFNVLKNHEFRSSYPHLFNFTDEELTYEPDINQPFQAEI
ncbi:protein kinase gsk3-like [Galendromus occidentalis]|uniref:Protein kinase gsk3-like n=1 Tax=Galendromus occidentalis TaxID=34638 RepID=A0AAJ7SGH3_9ACAR|nr:protein kinase gsk3-like [Galendromus occidentalis]